LLPYFDRVSGTFCGPQFVSRIQPPADGSLAVPTQPVVSNLVKLLVSQLGWPYDWGGKGFGVDCSGFVQRVLNHFIDDPGSLLPRNSGHQARWGKEVGSLSEAKTGDLLCYKGHIGFFARGGELRRNAPEFCWNETGNYL